MAEKITDKLVRTLVAPAVGNRITYDEEVKGFGVRITSAGAKAFILNYRAAGRERRITIGSFPDWSVADARNEARGLKRRIDVGEDPMADRHADRSAPTMNDLADRFDAEHLAKRRPKTQSDYRSIIRLYSPTYFGGAEGGRGSPYRHRAAACTHSEDGPLSRQPYCRGAVENDGPGGQVGDAPGQPCQRH